MNQPDHPDRPTDLFALPQLVVQVGIMQRQAAVDGENLKCDFVLFGEEAAPFVDELYDAEGGVASVDRHAEDRPRPIPRLSVDVRVEPRVFVSVGDVQGLAGRCHMT